MKRLLFSTLFAASLLAYSQHDMKSFIEWTLDPSANFDVVDYMVEDGEIDFNFPSITTKTASKSFKVLVIKKKPLEYNLSLYSYDLNTTVEFDKKLVISMPGFDVYKITIPYEYRNLRFVCKYSNEELGGSIDEDNSTDNFSVKPYDVNTQNSHASVFNILVDNGKSKYRAKGKNVVNHYSYAFENGKGVVDFWEEDQEQYEFCLDEGWTAIDQDDTPSTQRAMPCVKLTLYPLRTSWAGIGNDANRTIEINNSKIIFLRKVAW